MELRINHRPACDILLISGTPTAELLRADTHRADASSPGVVAVNIFLGSSKCAAEHFHITRPVLLTPLRCRFSVSFNYRARRPSR